jgi:PhoPQ-activated pathogenicity-related protein
MAKGGAKSVGKLFVSPRWRRRHEGLAAFVPDVEEPGEAMDALQEIAKEKWKTPVKGFVVRGASKRGLPTWLTAASDPRVVAIAPMVFDTLNMAPQMEHQKETRGAYSDMVHDDTERKLIWIPDSDAARRLWKMVDPFFYWEELTVELAGHPPSSIRRQSGRRNCPVQEETPCPKDDLVAPSRCLSCSL